MTPACTHVWFCVNHVLSYGKTLLHAWLKVQVSHRGGKYSIERLLALEEYTRTVSIFRVFAVCLCTPMLMMILVVAQELLPLSEPCAGWRANYAFWIRLALLGGVIAHTAIMQAQYLVDRVEISRIQRMLIACMVGISFSIVAAGIASVSVFPIPFIVISGVPVFYTLLLLSLWVIAGWRFFQNMAADWGQTIRYINYIGSQVLMAAMYPCYQTLFTLSVNTSYELPVILLLPLIKMLMKYLLSITTMHMEDLMPEAVIFTADFFNALYLATCMQRTRSLVTITTMMALDLGHTVVGLFALHRRTSSILTRIHEAVDDATQDSVLASVCLLCQNSALFAKQVREGVKLRSSLRYRLADPTRTLLDTLENISNDQQLKTDSPPLLHVRRQRPYFGRAESSDELKHFRRHLLSTLRRKFAANVHPIMPTKPVAVNEMRTVKNELVRGPSSPDLASSQRILQETLETLFTSECLVLTEYLESLIPVLYGCLVLVIVRLPSARYHIDMEGITRENANSTVQSVFILAFLEIFSFVVLIMVMKRNCGVQALYQLAFVLEAQTMLIQDKLTTWALVTMAFRVVHFDTLYTFKCSLGET